VTTASNPSPAPEVYRISARDRSGLFMGLGLAQLAMIGLGVVVGSVSAMVRGPMVFALPLCGLAVVIALVPYRGRPLVEQMGSLGSYLVDTVATRRRWAARLDLLGRGAEQLQLPPAMAGLILRELDVEGRPVAVVEDRRDGTLSASIRVSGRRFALASETEQDRMLEEWAQALAPLCRQGGPIVGLTWAEWTAPTRIEAHRAWMARSFDPTADARAAAAYEEVLALTGAHTARHDVIVTLSVSITKAARRPGARAAPASAAARLEAAASALGRELALFAGRLSAAGLEATAPLSAPELARALRDRLDPNATSRLDEYSRSLGDVAGVVSPHNAGPLAAEVGRTYWRTDQSLHRAFAVTEWPRIGVYADWLAGFLLDVGGVRTTAVCYRPVSPTESARRIAHQATQLESDEQIRRDKGYLVTGEHRRNKENVSKREQQLLDGHVEFTYCGIVVISAPDLESLDEQSEQVAQSAARCRMELRALDFQHDQAVTCTLPLGRRPKAAAL